MGRDYFGWTLIAAGLVFLAFSALADVIGIGDGDFGWKQILGVIIGGVVTLVGLALIYVGQRGGPKTPQAHA
jgi:hypothetical protein